MDWKRTWRFWWGYIYDQYDNHSDDVELLIDLIGEPPENIFEVCCGTGRVLVPLAKTGHNMVGMDADEGMLARIPAKAEGLMNLKYSLGNALTSDWGCGYDVVILEQFTYACGYAIDFLKPMIEASNIRLANYLDRVKIVEADIAMSNWQQSEFIGFS